MRNILKHKPADQDIGSGEIAIDVEAREVKLVTFRGVQTLPLDFVALEPRDENASGQVYVYRNDGIAHVEPFRAGGGGQADHGYAWSVPGLTPVAVTSIDVTDTHDALFEVQQPITIQGLRLRIEAGSADLVLAIVRENGSSVVSYLEQADEPGVVTRGVSVALDPGRYIARLTVTAPVTVQAIEGRLPWRQETQQHLMMMEIG